MPTYSKASPILDGAAGVVTQVLLTRKGQKYIEVFNWGSERISVRTDGTDPVANDAECDHVGPNSGAILESYGEPDDVRVIGTNAYQFSVRGVQQ